MTLTQHPKLRRGLRLTHEQIELYIAALFHLDTFQEDELCRDFIRKQSQPPPELNEEFFLQCAIEIVKRELFS